MNAARAVARLDEIARDLAHDPEAARARADDVLLAAVPPAVRAAYERVQAACPWWASS